MSRKDRAAPGFDPADVFAQLACRLERDPHQPLALSRWRERGLDRIQRLTSSITDSGLVTHARFERGMGSAEEAFVLACAIDRAFATIHPTVGSRHHGRLGRYRRRLRETLRYNRGPDDVAVLPRRAFPARPTEVPDHAADHWQALMVAPRAPRGLTLLRLPAAVDFPTSARRRSTIAVGCVPFLAGLDELAIRRNEDAGSWYSIRARTDGEYRTRLRERIADVIRGLDRADVHIGLLPELALTDEILEWWQELLVTIDPPSRSPLEWILVGTGPLTDDVGAEQPPNRAVLLQRSTGRVVLTQDKTEPFTLEDSQVRAWGLAGHLGTGPLAEWMCKGFTHTVVDARVGRFAVLVCEDGSRVVTIGNQLMAVGPTHLLVPIFAPPIVRYRWQEKAASELRTTIGCASVFATSCAVRTPPGDGTSLAVAPSHFGAHRESGGSAEVMDANGDPTHVATFRLPWG